MTSRLLERWEYRDHCRFGTRGLLRKYETARFSTPQLDQIAIPLTWFFYYWHSQTMRCIHEAGPIFPQQFPNWIFNFGTLCSKDFVTMHLSLFNECSYMRTYVISRHAGFANFDLLSFWTNNSPLHLQFKYQFKINYSSSKLRKTQNEHRLSKSDRFCSCEFKTNFHFFTVYSTCFLL